MYVPPALSLEVFHAVETQLVSYDPQNSDNSPNFINRLAFVIEIQCFFCEVEFHASESWDYLHTCHISILISINRNVNVVILD